MNFFRTTILLPALRRQPSKRIHPRSRIKPQSQPKRNPGFLYKTLLPLKNILNASQVIHVVETPPEVPVKEILTPRTFFRKLDEPLRFIFKVPFVQDFYTMWLRAEELDLEKSLEDKSYFLFLGEFLFYGKLGIETFEKLILSSYPEIATLPEYRENVIIFHHLISKNKNHIEESLYQLERSKKEEGEDEGREAPGPLSTRTYYRYIDLNVRPLFKFEIMQVLFGRWLKLEEVGINDCYEARYHNLFIEELLYYYDQGEGFVRSIVKNIYTAQNNQKLSEEDLNNIYILIRTFDAILDETVKKIKDSQGDLKDLDRKTFLNHGYDFGMILYYVANKDAFNALMTARSLVIETASKIWEKKKKKTEELGVASLASKTEG